MMINIKNIRARTVIGIDEWEKHKEQNLLVNIKAEYDASKVAETDNIDDAVDYCEIAHGVVKEIKVAKILVLEKLVGHVLDFIFKDERIKWLEVEIDKLEPLADIADSVSIMGRRER